MHKGDNTSHNVLNDSATLQVTEQEQEQEQEEGEQA